MKNIIVLAFGHIPTWAGGRQESGAANVIYNIANAMSKDIKMKIALASTDLYINRRKEGELELIGWKKIELIYHICHHPIDSFVYLIYLLFAILKYGSGVKIFRMFFKGMFLHKCCKTEQPDIVHLHGADSIIYHHIIPRNIKILVTIHGFFGQNPQIFNYRSLKKFEEKTSKSKRINRLVFISHDLISQYSKAYGEIVPKTEVIINAYDSKNFFYIQPTKHEKLTLLTIASFSENKGQKRVIEAIFKSRLDIKYICIGAFTLEQEKECAILANKLNVDYEYYGTLPPQLIRKSLSKVDYMILPSITEGFGLVFLESIACGIPVIIPKNLPIVKEKGLIKPFQNALLLDDYSINSIEKILVTLDTISFSHKDVAISINDISWEKIGSLYNCCCNTIQKEC